MADSSLWLQHILNRKEQDWHYVKMQEITHEPWFNIQSCHSGYKLDIRKVHVPEYDISVRGTLRNIFDIHFLPEVPDSEIFSIFCTRSYFEDCLLPLIKRQKDDLIFIDEGYPVCLGAKSYQLSGIEAIKFHIANSFLSDWEEDNGLYKLDISHIALTDEIKKYLAEQLNAIVSEGKLMVSEAVFQQAVAELRKADTKQLRSDCGKIKFYSNLNLFGAKKPSTPANEAIEDESSTPEVEFCYPANS